MTKPYSFLKDELATIEIRKHKWIESEKCGFEIGFATAAIDWIRKYGVAWKQYRMGTRAAGNIFSEKRQHRRFNYKLPLQIKVNDNWIAGYTEDISLVGISCTIPDYIPQDTITEVTIRIPKEKLNIPQEKVNFKARVMRIGKPDPQKADHNYNIFLPFNEDIRDYIRANAEIFVN